MMNDKTKFHKTEKEKAEKLRKRPRRRAIVVASLRSSSSAAKYVMEEFNIKKSKLKSQIVAVKSSTWTVASMIIETRAECAKMEVEHYYKACRGK